MTSGGERFAGAALLALVLGLVVHNAAMAQLWEAGVRGRALDVTAAWKEVLLLVALAAALWGARGVPRVTLVDVLAACYAGIVVVYALLPQDLLDGGATTRGELLALRHYLLPVAAYALGRLVSRLWEERSRLGAAIVVAAVVVAVAGLVDLAIVSLQSWRESGVPGWYREQLELDYEGLSGLPENWVYNTGDEENPIRRLVATLLSPLASAYVLVVALVYVLSRRLTVWWALLAALVYAALLYTHTRAALGALVVGLVVLAVAQRRVVPAVLAAVSIAAGAAFLAVYPSIGPSTSYTEEELEFLRQNAQEEPGTSSDPFSPSESSTASHWRNLRDGVRAVLEHPQGYGLGNAGVVAKADRRRDQGGRVHVHGGRHRRRPRRDGRVRALEPRAARRPAAARAVARRGVRRRSAARAPDRRDRRALARRRRLGRGRRRAPLLAGRAPGSTRSPNPNPNPSRNRNPNPSPTESRPRASVATTRESPRDGRLLRFPRPARASPVRALSRFPYPFVSLVREVFSIWQPEP